MGAMPTTKYKCIKEDKIDRMQEDLITIKTALGYKEKTNGEFRQEVEETDKNLNERLGTIEETVVRIDERQNSQQNILMIFFTVLIGALALITII